MGNLVFLGLILHFLGVYICSLKYNHMIDGEVFFDGWKGDYDESKID
jgi:hypothetical protein